MSIKDIDQTQRIKVLLRLLDNQENIEIACSKAGLNLEIAKKLLSLN
ncbi:MAG: hypothetical protein PHX65_08500 [Sulfurimonas sp.]|nr:hypothetical protein [Sulfurimonas sp.]